MTHPCFSCEPAESRQPGLGYMTGMNTNLAFASQKPTDISDIIKQLESVIVGKGNQIQLALACLLAHGHLLIEDMPGVGKTTLAHAIAMTLGLPWKRVQFTSDLLPADIIGVSIFNQAQARFEFHQGPVFSSILLADEVNRAPPKVQSALLESMEERQISIDGNTYELPDPFFVIATLNPADRLGAFSLPESQLDRFLVGISLGYPPPEAERELLISGDRRESVEKLKALCDAETLKKWQHQSRSVFVADPILDYVQALLLETRNQKEVVLNGLSPRAGVNLLALSRAWALMQGRDMVLPEDVQSVFPALAGHRLCGSVSEGMILSINILESVPVGRI